MVDNAFIRQSSEILKKRRKPVQKIELHLILERIIVVVFLYLGFLNGVLTDSLIHKNKDDIIVTIHRKGFIFNQAQTHYAGGLLAVAMMNTYDFKITF